MENKSVTKQKNIINTHAFFSFVSGGTAAVLTQPFEVIKTVQLCSSSGKKLTIVNSIKQVYQSNSSGLFNFFRGGLVGCVRQSIGFCIYSQIIEKLNDLITIPSKTPLQKLVKTSLISGISKTIAITFTCPMVVLKTRLEFSQNASVLSEIRNISKQGSYFRGLGGMISRELAYSMFQYSFFQFLLSLPKDNYYKLNNPFVASYISGLLGVALSHPFEVIRNRMMISDSSLPAQYRYVNLIQGFKVILSTEGIKGFFQALLPRLVRKPINTAISWGMYEVLKGKGRKE